MCQVHLCSMYEFELIHLNVVTWSKYAIETTLHLYPGLPCTSSQVKVLALCLLLHCYGPGNDRSNAPISSRMTKDWEVALVRMLAVSDISMWNVDMCLATLSLAPTRAKRRSTTPTTAFSAGTKLPIWENNNRFLVVAARRKLLCTLCIHRSPNAGRNRRTWRQKYADSCSNKRTSFHGYCLLLVTTTEHGGVSTADRRYTSPNIDHRAHLNPTDLVPPGYARL